MASPGFTKRQREQARKEKQRDKAARKLARKRDKELGIVSPDDQDMMLAGENIEGDSDEQDASAPEHVESAVEEKQ
jgi:hypothetical protein